MRLQVLSIPAVSRVYPPGAVAQHSPCEKYDKLLFTKTAVSDQRFSKISPPLTTSHSTPIFKLTHFRHQGIGINAPASSYIHATLRAPSILSTVVAAFRPFSPYQHS